MNLCIFVLFARSVSLLSPFSNQKIGNFRLVRLDFERSENRKPYKNLDKKYLEWIFSDHATKNGIGSYIHKFLFRIQKFRRFEGFGGTSLLLDL
ncbi:hypothetical protein B2G51_03655 [Leptospira santarosai]|nr:hypothetical protein B2G51_03655 [Leptospira santarosai]